MTNIDNVVKVTEQKREVSMTFVEIRKQYLQDISSGRDPVRIGSREVSRKKLIAGLGFDAAERLGVLDEYKAAWGIK